MNKIVYTMLIICILSAINIATNKNTLPEDSIRFRIIANSNTKIDQTTKLLIKKDLENKLFPLLENSKSANETKQIIYENQEVINESIQKYNVPYSVNYGENYFPKKIYNGVTYEEGQYESLVISLGEGKGNNWWCVMYPPLCLVENKTEREEQKEYKFFLWEIVSKLTS